MGKPVDIFSIAQKSPHFSKKTSEPESKRLKGKRIAPIKTGPTHPILVKYMPSGA